MWMNKRQKELLQSQLDDERAVLKKLKGIYKKSLDDIDSRIAELMGRTDTENLQSIAYQVQYQQALKTQISGILDTMNAEQFTSISDYLTKCYESGYIGTMYDLAGQGIPMIMPINQKRVVNALQLDSKLSKPLYDTLGEDIDLLKKRVQNNISRGFAQGSSYAEIARNIASGMVGDYTSMKGGALYNAMRITRTEGHRIQQQAADDARYYAKSKGADIVKQWDSTLDSRTRLSHMIVDGEIRELDERFSNGLRYPGDSNGAAAEVVNCRCACLQRAKWALDDEELQTLKDRAAYYGLDKSENFEDFKKKYLEVPGNVSYNGNDAGRMRIGIQFFASKEKQFGKKVGKHAVDFGLDPSNADDRVTFQKIIDDIVDNHDEIRIGDWRGQADDVLFYIKGENVVITKQSGEFITILKGGIQNARVKNARIK